MKSLLLILCVTATLSLIGCKDNPPTQENFIQSTGFFVNYDSGALNIVSTDFCLFEPTTVRWTSDSLFVDGVMGGPTFKSAIVSTVGKYLLILDDGSKETTVLHIFQDKDEPKLKLYYFQKRNFILRLGQYEGKLYCNTI
jgi:hypothetical protein